jgi:hypothetical protein
MVGLAVVSFFGVLNRLIESGVFPQLAQGDAAPLVNKLLDYGFFIELIVVLSGFGLRFYKLSKRLPLAVSSTDQAALTSQRNRRRILDKVRHMWVHIKGLKPSLRLLADLLGLEGSIHAN